MATTISAYSVSLSLDAGHYIKNSSLSRSETARLKREINDARTPAEVFKNKLGLLEKALESGAIDLKVFNRLTEEAGNKLRKAAGSTGVFANGLGTVKSAIAALGLGYLVKQSVSLAIQLEQASVQFEVLTGSAEQAADILDELRRFAAASPITFVGTQEAARTLLQFGISGSKVVPIVRMLGEVSAGNQQRFDSLALAFGQMSAAGRLMGQDLLQMINAGFNPLQEISRKTGESLIDLKKRMEDGAISSQEVVAAFESATAEGGRFYGMTERLSGTLGGKLAVSMSRIQELGASIGDTLAPLIIQMTDGFERGESAMQGVLWVVEKLADGLGFMVAALQDGAKGFELLWQGLSGGGWESLEIDNINAFLDKVEQRDRERKAKQEAGARSPASAAAEQDAAQMTGLDEVLGNGIQDGFDALRRGIFDGSEFIGGINNSLAGLEDMARQINAQAAEDEKKNATLNDQLAKSFEVGSQEAYQYIAQQGQTDKAKEEQHRKKVEQEAEQSNKFLAAIVEWSKENGFAARR